MAKISTTHTFEALKAELKAYLGISGTGEDVNLELWWLDALTVCDAFLANPFTDANGNDVDTLGDGAYWPIKLGLFKYVKQLRDTEGQTAGLTKVKTDVLEEWYSTESAQTTPLARARKHWMRWRKKVWR